MNDEVSKEIPLSELTEWYDSLIMIASPDVTYKEDQLEMAHWVIKGNKHIAETLLDKIVRHL